MKTKFVCLIFLTFPLVKQATAQDFPIGHTMGEVREFRSTFPHSAAVVSQSDTLDVYMVGTMIYEKYFYQNGKCFKSQQRYTLDTNETMAESVKLAKMINDAKWKRVKENLWTNPAQNEQIELKVDADEKHYTVEIRTAAPSN